VAIGIVDLGLVYRAEWTEKGIDVDVTMTSPFCPFGQVIVDQANEVLHRRFGEAASIRVNLVWEPPWTLDRISETAREQLGWTRKSGTSPTKSGLGMGRAFGLWKH
jgi:metal-sulfur cluster biosynthetic enzyme